MPLIYVHLHLSTFYSFFKNILQRYESSANSSLRITSVQKYNFFYVCEIVIFKKKKKL